jgi:predicted DNA-binding WGR domain protein
VPSNDALTQTRRTGRQVPDASGKTSAILRAHIDERAWQPRLPALSAWRSRRCFSLAAHELLSDRGNGENTMSGKRFELVEGSSSKFWEIHVDGSEVHVRYGKIGSQGQTSVKNEGSPERATAAAEKLIREKTKKGYSEVGASETPAKVAPAKEAPPKDSLAKVGGASASEAELGMAEAVSDSDSIDL